jgi:RHS repeat-associated protein
MGRSTTTVKNSQGQTVSVTDALSSVTSYLYEPFGNLKQVTDAVGNVTTYTYDTRGRKVAASDPDLGSWTYTYNVLDQLQTQTDAAGLVTTVSYDLLGRTTQRVEPDLTSTWTYDTAANGIGKPASAATNTGYSRAHTYDALGRPSQTQITIASTTYAITTAYDSASRISSITYPSGFAVSYAYNAFGYQTQLTNSATSQVYWTANARDAEGHLTQQTAGNGVVTSRAFNADTGMLTGITSGSAGAVQSHAYTYDLLGKLMSRSDANTALNETFVYDELNRLTSATVSLSPTPLVKTFAYNAIGNLTSKSDVGTYTYPAAGQPRPHAVTSISGGTINTTFTYDAKGNVTAGNGLTVSYSSYDKPTSITRGTTTIGFSHDPEHQRFQQTAPGGTTLYLGNAEKFTGTGGAIRWTNYLMASGGVVGMHVENSDETVSTRYFHKDHLGSISVITDESGAVLERLSYDAWGKRRHPNGSDDPSGSITSQSSRGFTGHEELDSVGLVHMNGRVYDPLLARFGTADPMTESPFSTQGWNRYSYVGNSPLNFTDPSGYCFMGCFWQSAFRAIGTFLRQNWGSLFQIAATAACAALPGCQPFLPVVAGLASAFVTGVTSGDLGKALKAGLISAVTAMAFSFVGDVTLGPGHPVPEFGSTAHLANIAGHAAVGCLSAVASGGKCGPGALAAGVSAAGGPLIENVFPNPNTNVGSLFGGTAASAVLGGLGSVAGGGKFANGAVTGAFGYLFNQAMQDIGRRVTNDTITLTAPDGQSIMRYEVPPSSRGANVYDAPIEGGKLDVTGWTAYEGPPGTEVTRPWADGTRTDVWENGVIQFVNPNPPTRAIPIQSILREPRPVG